MSATGFRFVVDGAGGRLDRLVADATNCGRRAVRDWFVRGLVRVDGHVAAGALRAQPGSLVEIEGSTGAPVPEPGSVRVIYEDANLVAVAKPAAMHCERGKSPGSVADALEALYGDLSAIGDRAAEAGLVHRIDRDTSGIVLAARDRATYARLRGAFASGIVRKQYLALAHGVLARSVATDFALARRGNRMVVASRHDDSQPARTRFEPLEAGRDWTLVLATMATGVMHQVRAHLSAVGHPLLGDVAYGGPRIAGPRAGQLLHAMRVQLGTEIDLTCAPPGDFLVALAQLRRRA